MRSPCVPGWVSTLLFALALPTAGCASDHDKVEKQLAKLREQVAELQADTDRMGERLDSVEASNAPATSSEQRLVTVASQTMSRPKLKVVRVDPNAGTVPEASDADSDAGPRVVIQGEGKALETRTLPGTARPAPKPEKVDKAEKPATKAEPAPTKK